ncbi:MAG: carbamate kinase, partial [bacterium]
IGYMIQQTLGNVLAEKGRPREVVSVVTQVVVDDEDPAFENPVKPIGPFYSAGEAKKLAQVMGWNVVDDSNRGYRRVVPSPYPIDIVEIKAVKRLIEAGVIVITVGGGGIPVVRRGGHWEGVEAVIDKDLASSLLAREIGAERLIIVTSVDAVYKDFGKPGAKPLADVTVDEIRDLYEQGQFPAGSMGSKIQAAMEFIEFGGECVIITDPGNLLDAVEGRKGTTIRRGAGNGD